MLALSASAVLLPAASLASVMIVTYMIIEEEHADDDGAHAIDPAAVAEIGRG